MKAKTKNMYGRTVHLIDDPNTDLNDYLRNQINLVKNLDS